MKAIKKILTPYNYNEGRTEKIKYIAIHYVGATGSAKANCNYSAEAYRGASAHYFVDFNGDIYQSVNDNDTAWHCGSKTYIHPECRNSNSIGIEMCVRNKGNKAADSNDWYFEEETVKSTIELTKELMAKYGIDPEHVVTHNMITGKICPNPYVKDPEEWKEFKAALGEKKTGWEADGKEWKYYSEEKKAYLKNEWLLYNAEWYYLDETCRTMHDAWFEYKGEWYYFGPTGATVKGFKEIDGIMYIFESDGRMKHDEELKIIINADGDVKIS